MGLMQDVITCLQLAVTADMSVGRLHSPSTLNLACDSTLNWILFDVDCNTQVISDRSMSVCLYSCDCLSTQNTRLFDVRWIIQFWYVLLCALCVHVWFWDPCQRDNRQGQQMYKTSKPPSWMFLSCRAAAAMALFFLKNINQNVTWDSSWNWELLVNN